MIDRCTLSDWKWNNSKCSGVLEFVLGHHPFQFFFTGDKTRWIDFWSSDKTHTWHLYGIISSALKTKTMLDIRPRLFAGNGMLINQAPHFGKKGWKKRTYHPGRKYNDFSTLMLVPIGPYISVQYLIAVAPRNSIRWRILGNGVSMPRMALLKQRATEVSLNPRISRTRWLLGHRWSWASAQLSGAFAPPPAHLRQKKTQRGLKRVLCQNLVKDFSLRFFLVRNKKTWKKTHTHITFGANRTPQTSKGTL